MEQLQPPSATAQAQTDGTRDLDGQGGSAKKFLSIVSLSRFRKERSNSQKSKKTATKNASPPLRFRKEKPSARKERKATQTLAIVLGKIQNLIMFSNFLCHLPDRKLRHA